MNAEIIIDNMIAGFIALNAEGVVTKANARSAAMLRKPIGEIEGQTIWSTFPGMAGSNGEREIRQVLATGAQRRFEMFSPPLYNWFQVTAVPAGPDEIYVFFKDVTDRERAMQSDAVRESLRRILMDAPVAITITRGPEHRIELMNNSSRAIVGGRDLEGLTMRNALPEVDDALFEIMDGVYRNGERITLADLGVTFDREGNGVMHTGVFDVTYQPMRDTTGTVVGVISTSVETTGYSSARKALQSQPTG